MNNSLTLVDVTEQLIRKLVRAGIRGADLLEMRKVDPHKSAEDHLIDSLNVSDVCKMAVLDGRPMAIFGTAFPKTGLINNSRSVWLISTDEAAQKWFSFGKVSRGVVEMMMERYSHLYNFVDVENVVSIAWLKWLGFTVYEDSPVMYGYENRYPFYYFEIVRC
jgi:hypothetical protein